jgi:G:T-mismatch repair DNA endonuclease (very short patch repair protein)
VKNRINKDFWKVKMQRQIKKWRKELYMLAVPGFRSEIIKLNMKRIIFRNIR